MNNDATIRAMRTLHETTKGAACVKIIADRTADKRGEAKYEVQAFDHATPGSVVRRTVGLTWVAAQEIAMLECARLGRLYGAALHEARS